MRNKRPWLGLSVWLWSGGPVQPDDQAQIHAHPKVLLAEDVLPFPFPLPQDLGYLVTKRKLEDEDNFEDWVNHHSKVGAAAAWGRAMGVLLPLVEPLLEGMLTLASTWTATTCGQPCHGAAPHSAAHLVHPPFPEPCTDTCLPLGPLRRW